MIIKFDCLAPKGYNILQKGESSVGYKHSEETKMRMSLLKKGKKQSKEHIEKGRRSRIGRKHSEESKLKMRNSQLGNKYSEESKLKMSLAKKGKPVSEKCKNRAIEVNTGRKMSDETKLKISVANTGKKWENHKLRIPIIQIDPTTSQIIKVWDSTIEAAKYLDKKPANINACLRGKQNTAFGFKWEYLV